MYIYLEENTNSYHKGQLTPFFIAILTVLVIGIMVTVNIGKVSLVKTHTSNSADAGALAAASVCAMGFDNLALMSQTMYFIYLYYLGGIETALDTAEDDLEQSWAWVGVGITLGLLGATLACCCAVASKTIHIILVLGAIAALITGEYFFQRAWLIDMAYADELIGTLHSYQQSYYESLKETMEEVLTVSAPDTGYSMALSNSGFSSMLGDDQSEDFQNAINNSLTAFSFKDGQERNHSENNSISLASISNWHLYVTNDDKPTIEDYFFEFDIYAFIISAAFLYANMSLTQEVEAASLQPDCGGWVVTAVGVDGCIIPASCAAYGIFTAVIVAAAIAELVSILALPPIIDDIRNGVQENGVVTDPSGDEILVTLQDVTHSRQLNVSSIQSHEGIDLGLWQMNYPTVNASATASFSGGNLDGHSPSETHNPRLIKTK
ncbi:MAG: hypothetical protein K9L99_05910 [Candidatus Omnitrophica bacterium]|nr:hypothetical protein [Candidatus Omnitrophota bacterium]MCF7917245.1 hypothetical protein [Candidatus Omnitrophota bacterium]